MKKLLNELVLYIVDYLQDIEAPVSTIRIIKFLYLIDYEFYLSKGKKLTSINWLRYKFGPYFHEWPDTVRELRIDLDVLEVINEDKKLAVYSTYDEHDIEGVTSWPTKQLINIVLDKWGFDDLEEILDYVYTDTEPMQNAKMNQTLDFSKIEIGFDRKRKSKYLELNPQESIKIKDLITKNKVIKKSKMIEFSYDDDFFIGLEIMNREDTELARLEGKVFGTDALFN